MEGRIVLVAFVTCFALGPHLVTGSNVQCLQDCMGDLDLGSFSATPTMMNRKCSEIKTYLDCLGTCGSLGQTTREETFKTWRRMGLEMSDVCPVLRNGGYNLNDIGSPVDSQDSVAFPYEDSRSMQHDGQCIQGCAGSLDLQALQLEPRTKQCSDIEAYLRCLKTCGEVGKTAKELTFKVWQDQGIDMTEFCPGINSDDSGSPPVMPVHPHPKIVSVSTTRANPGSSSGGSGQTQNEAQCVQICVGHFDLETFKTEPKYEKCSDVEAYLKCLKSCGQLGKTTEDNTFKIWSDMGLNMAKFCPGICQPDVITDTAICSGWSVRASFFTILAMVLLVLKLY